MFRKRQSEEKRKKLLDAIRERIAQVETAGKTIPQPVKDLVKGGIDIIAPRVGKIIDVIRGLKEDTQVDPLVKEDISELLENLLEHEKLFNERIQNDNEYLITRLTRPVITFVVVFTFIFGYWAQALNNAYWNVSPNNEQRMWELTLMVVGFWFVGRTIKKDIAFGMFKK